MRQFLVSTLVMAFGAVIPSHAIFGIGGQWAPAPTLSVKAASGAVASHGADSIILNNGKSDALNGFGVKLWVDFLPLVDLEFTSNVQFATYKSSFLFPNGSGGNTTVPLSFDLGFPMAPSTPVFARWHNDLAVLYPFLKLPPVVNLVKVYGGGGLSYGMATPVLTASFAKEAMTKAKASGKLTETSSQTQVAALLTDAVTSEDPEMGMGFFLQLGAKVKPPVIPFAAFANLKYQFFSFMPKAIDGPGVTLELGGALAF